MAGSAVGTSDLIVALAPARRVTGSVEADNAGNRYTGVYRAGGTVDLNNPLGLGEQFSGRILASSGGLAYGRASYQAPVAGATLGVAYTHVRYRLSREFERLDADGTADIVGAHAGYPLVRSRRYNLHALGNVEAKWFEDRIGLVSTRSNKRSRVATVGFAADAGDGLGGGGSSSLSAGWSFGELDIRTRSSEPPTRAPLAPPAASRPSISRPPGFRPSAARCRSTVRSAGNMPSAISIRRKRSSWAALTACAPIPKARPTAMRA